MKVRIRLREIRKERGFSQQELADRIGYSQGIVSHIERGAPMGVSLKAMASLCAVLEISPADLFSVEYEQLELLPTEKD